MSDEKMAIKTEPENYIARLVRNLEESVDLASRQAARVGELEREKEAWQETAAQHARNEDYYRGLVVQIGEMLGEQAYISDDGSVQDSVLCAKVPELVAARFSIPCPHVVTSGEGSSFCRLAEGGARQAELGLSMPIDAFADYLPVKAEYIAPGEYKIVDRSGRHLFHVYGTSLAEWIAWRLNHPGAGLAGGSAGVDKATETGSGSLIARCEHCGLPFFDRGRILQGQICRCDWKAKFSVSPLAAEGGEA